MGLNLFILTYVYSTSSFKVAELLIDFASLIENSFVMKSSGTMYYELKG